MSIKVKIPRQKVTQKTFPRKNGPGETTVTKFTAMAWEDATQDYTAVRTCEALGDYQAALEAAYGSNEPIEVESMEWTDQYGGRWNVKFPKGTGRQGNYGQRYGGGGGGWKPEYRGKPVTFDRWWEYTGKAMDAAVKAVMKSIGGDVEHMPAVIEAAQGLVSTWQIAMQKSLTFIPGCEPEATADSAPATQAAPTGAGGSASGAGADEKAAIMAVIKGPAASYDYDAVKARIAASKLGDDDRIALMQANLGRKKALTMSAAADGTEV